MEQTLAFPESTIFVIVLIGLGIFMALAISLVQVLIFCKLFGKAGYHWAYGLLILLPLANIILHLFLAFADWPVRRELRELRQRLGQAAT